MKRSSGWRRLLWPLSTLYSLGSRTRVRCYRRGIFKVRRLPGTVISVGNLTMGGTGKTPMALWIAERLAAEGKKTAILTRGYRGTADAGAQGLPQSDEVAILRERLSGKVQIGVGADRYKIGEVLARHGVEWFILDDGFQHLKMSRDADIVLVDASDPFGGGMVLPAGRLREPVSALRRADIVVITRSMQAPSSAVEAVIRRHTQSSIFYATTQLESVLRVPQLAAELPPQDWRRARFMAFCAIGNPAAFFEDLRKWEFQVVGERGFADHHVYTEHEVTDLEQAATNCGADALLCTEKDVWNLRRVPFAGMPVYCCRISLQLPGKFRDALDEAIERNKVRVAR
jgi:tetraacyldisaccharide 4'-kinase